MPARTPVSKRIRILQISLIVAVSLVSFAALTLPIGLRRVTQVLNIGDVSQTTQNAPRDIEYVSDIRTEEARIAAESAVLPVYSQPDSAIARQQIERLDTAMQYVTSVRDNRESSLEQKKTDLVALSDVRLKPETIEYLLAISASRWDTLQAEALRVLEQVMRRAIHEDKVDSAQAGISSFVSLT